MVRGASSGARAVSAGGLQDRIANATDRTAKPVEGLRQDLKDNKPAFV